MQGQTAVVLWNEGLNGSAQLTVDTPTFGPQFRSERSFKVRRVVDVMARPQRSLAPTGVARSQGDRAGSRTNRRQRLLFGRVRFAGIP